MNSDLANRAIYQRFPSDSGVQYVIGNQQQPGGFYDVKQILATSGDDDYSTLSQSGYIPSSPHSRYPPPSAPPFSRVAVNPHSHPQQQQQQQIPGQGLISLSRTSSMPAATASQLLNRHMPPQQQQQHQQQSNSPPVVVHYGTRQASTGPVLTSQVQTSEKSNSNSPYHRSSPRMPLKNQELSNAVPIDTGDSNAAISSSSVSPQLPYIDDRPNSVNRASGASQDATQLKAADDSGSGTTGSRGSGGSAVDLLANRQRPGSAGSGSAFELYKKSASGPNGTPAGANEAKK